MKILYLNTTYSGGGAERVTRQIYEGMKKRGHDVYEIVCYNRRGPVRDDHVYVLYQGKAGKILQRVQTFNRGNENVTIPYAVRKICRFIRQHKIDLVHLNNPHDSFLGIRDIRTIQKLCPMVWTLHDFWALTGHCAFPYGCEDRWISGCRKCGRLENYPRLRRDVCAKLFDKKREYLTGAGIRLVVPSAWMLEQVKKSYLKEEDCRIISNSLDISRWRCLDKADLRKKYGIETEKMVLAFVAADMRIPQKGMKFLRQILSGLDPEKYLLLAAGKCGDDLQKMTEGFETRYFGYISEQEEMNEFYGLADVMVNPSVYETFGLVNIEAMASGTPVMAFDVCAMKEILGTETGWCIPEITSEAMQQKLIELEENRSELREKGDLCHESVRQRYDETKMLDDYEEMYRSLLGLEE